LVYLPKRYINKMANWILKIHWDTLNLSWTESELFLLSVTYLLHTVVIKFYYNELLAEISQWWHVQCSFTGVIQFELPYYHAYNINVFIIVIYKYIGHYITRDENFNRQPRTLYVQGNILLGEFYTRYLEEKIMLFCSYRSLMYIR